MKLIMEGWRRFLTERREGLWRMLKSPDSPVANWPDYVIQQVVYNAMKPGHTLESIEDWLFNDLKVDNLDQIIWRKENIQIDSIKSFDTSTQKQLPSRHKDIERMKTQVDLAKERGAPSAEPIIVFKTSGGYHLLEGWHRTLTYLTAWGSYIQPAYVAETNI
tara:strand:- start:991 stop:1476 length:486 start_codon:yes stop_codon:yes gene_type:complete